MPSVGIDVPERIESRVSKSYLYTHVDCSIIHNSQEVEAPN